MPLITRKKMSGEHSFPFERLTLRRAPEQLERSAENMIERLTSTIEKRSKQDEFNQQLPPEWIRKENFEGSDRGSGVSGLTEGESTVNAPKRLARIAGVLYLLVGIFRRLLPKAFVEPKMYVAGNAAATLGTLSRTLDLSAWASSPNLLGQTCFIFLATALYILLKHVHKNVARAMVIIVALAVGITCLNTVFEFEGLRVATGAVNPGRLGHRGFECPGAALARHPALWISSRRSSLACGWCR